MTIGGPTAINLRISKMDEERSEQAYTELAPKRKKIAKRPVTAQKSSLAHSYLNEFGGQLPAVAN